ncbi:MAG TPA: ChbG/HpnK family deacetylase [Thermoanaerobaculia bacterium]|nr:ChbG/HpnK family deacetylase [Thermoanaerobaculia bacterium]
MSAPAAKRLIVTADDVGLHRGMTEGAIRAHRDGVVTACSLVANGVAFYDAVERLRDAPSLEVGVHLTLVEERSLTGMRVPNSYVGFLLGQKDVAAIERELRAQIERVLAAGLRVTHLNGHQHVHMWPHVFAIVSELADEYGIGYVRRVRDRGGRGGIVRRISIAALNALGSGGSTIGVMEAGHLTADRIVQLLRYVRGTTELVTHPGIDVDAYPHWNYDWNAETEALCDPRVREAIADRGIELVAPGSARL